MSWKEIRIAASEPLRGTGVNNLKAQPQKTFGEGRVCKTEGCSTTLSRYNKNDRCYLHVERKPVPLDDRELRRIQKERQKGRK